jgi:hypothetical protein
MIFDSTIRPSCTTAAAVSSHDDSIESSSIENTKGVMYTP